MTLIEQFLTEHAAIEGGLKAAEAACEEPTKLSAQLDAMRASVVDHLIRKDAFYPALIAQSEEAKDVAAAQLTRIFESNMKVQSAAVQRFFGNFEKTAPTSLASAFRTVLTVLRQRFATEEKAIFPLYQRTLKQPETP